MIDSPDRLEPEYQFVESISSYLSELCDIHTISIKRYFKIEEYVQVKVEIIQKEDKNKQQNTLCFFASIIENLGSSWSLNGTDEQPEAVWNKTEDSYFFQEEVRWVWIEAISF